DAPEPVVLWPVWRTVIHQGGRAIGDRPVDDIAVAGHPADICRAPTGVIITKVEDIFHGGINPYEISACCVQDAFRFPGRTTRVENVERMLAVQGGGRTMPINVFHLAVPPDIAALFNVYLVTGASKNDHSLD